MRYAVFSDIHCNFPALKAALYDALQQDIDALIFAGDYLNDQPYVNETLDLIFSQKNAYTISGNRDISALNCSAELLKSAQFAASRCCLELISTKICAGLKRCRPRFRLKHRTENQAYGFATTPTICET